MFKLDNVASRVVGDKKYICLDYIPLRRQKHVKEHASRNNELFIFIPCECGSGEMKQYVEKEHLRVLLNDFND